jgi:hypothetical protein
MHHFEIGVDISSKVIETSRRIFAFGEDIYLQAKAVTVSM